MLISFKVEKLVIAAIPDLVGTWTEGFGFVPVEDGEKQSLNKINLMVFPGTVLLKKPLCGNKTAYRHPGIVYFFSLFLNLAIHSPLFWEFDSWSTQEHWKWED